MLAFLAQDADTRVFCYANGDSGQEDEQNDEILRFIEFWWKQRTGHLPEELIFDSKLTTYANLHKLNRMGIQFITLRRRSKKLPRRDERRYRRRPGDGSNWRAPPGRISTPRSSWISGSLSTTTTARSVN